MNKSIFNTAVAAAAAALFCVGCGKDDGGDNGKKSGNPAGPGTATPTPAITKFVDSRDGTSYKKVTIGGKTWMAENLNYNVSGSKCFGEGGISYIYDKSDSTRYIRDTTRNIIDTIFKVTNTILAVSEVRANCDKYGRLYDWSTATNGTYGSSSNPSGVRGVCPAGWHLPSDAEWTALENSVGSYAGTKLKSKEKWEDDTTGTDSYGFSALPGGYGKYDGNFDFAGHCGYWWSATGVAANRAWNRYMLNHYGETVRYIYNKSGLLSVRCVQD